jgi:hypothetical protein
MIYISARLNDQQYYHITPIAHLFVAYLAGQTTRSFCTQPAAYICRLEHSQYKLSDLDPTDLALLTAHES